MPQFAVFLLVDKPGTELFTFETATGPVKERVPDSNSFIAYLWDHVPSSARDTWRRAYYQEFAGTKPEHYAKLTRAGLLTGTPTLFLRNWRDMDDPELVGKEGWHPAGLRSVLMLHRFIWLQAGTFVDLAAWLGGAAGAAVEAQDLYGKTKAEHAARVAAAAAAHGPLASGSLPGLASVPGLASATGSGSHGGGAGNVVSDEAWLQMKAAAKRGSDAYVKDVGAMAGERMEASDAGYDPRSEEVLAAAQLERQAKLQAVRNKVRATDGRAAPVREDASDAVEDVVVEPYFSLDQEEAADALLVSEVSSWGEERPRAVEEGTGLKMLQRA